MKSSIETEFQRLEAYYPFDNVVLETVAEVADAHRRTTWDALRHTLPDTSMFTPVEGKPIEILDIIPQQGYESVYTYHLSMGNGIDPNAMTRLAVLSQVLPASRIIVAGNPSHPFKTGGKIQARDLPAVWRGDLRGTVGPTMEYIATQGVEEVSHVGYSYGADRAAAAVQYSGAYDQQVIQGIFMEPAAIERRGIMRLGRAFARSAAALPQYIDAAASPTLNRALQLTEQERHGVLGFTGLLRASNLAIAHALSSDGFAGRVTDALNTQIDMSGALVWGTESEIATHGVMQEVSDRLQKHFPERITPVIVQNQKHAMGDDTFLHAALIAQSIQSAK